MTTRGTVTWGKLVEICRERGIEIHRGKGSEVKLKGPAPDGGICVMRIGHKCCGSRSDDVWIDYVKKFQRTYGVTNEDLWG